MALSLLSFLIAVLLYVAYPVGNRKLIIHSPIHLRKIFQLLSQPKIWLLAVFTGLMYTHIAVIYGTWGGTYLATKYHLNLVVSDSMNELMIVGLLIGLLCFERCYKIAGAYRYMLIGAVVLCITVVVSLSTDFLGKYGEMIDLLVMGFATAACLVPFVIIKKIVVDKGEHSFLVGFFNMCYYLIPAFVGPYVAAMHMQSSNWHLATIPVVLATMLTVVIAVILYRKPFYIEG